jgi:hypothetical protein
VSRQAHARWIFSDSIFEVLLVALPTALLCVSACFDSSWCCGTTSPILTGLSDTVGHGLWEEVDQITLIEGQDVGATP